MQVKIKHTFKNFAPPLVHFLSQSKIKSFRLKKITVLAALFILSASAALFADSAEKGIYTTINGRAELPVIFTGKEKLTGLGGGGSIEIGYDFDGWLFGASYTLSSYSEKNADDYLIENLMHNTIGINISKIINSRILTFLPSALAIRPSLCAACDIVSADYYKSLDAKKFNLKSSQTQVAFSYSAGLFIEYEISEIMTPFTGAVVAFEHDKKGTFIMPSIISGFRLTYGL